MRMRVIKRNLAKIARCLKKSVFFVALWMATAESTNLVIAGEIGNEERQRLSLVNLIATPERFDGKHVAVRGWAIVEFERTALCLTIPNIASKDCVWLDLSDTSITQSATANDEKLNYWRKFHRKAVFVIGKFDMAEQGHLGAFSGSLREIQNIKLIDSRSAGPGPN